MCYKLLECFTAMDLIFLFIGAVLSALSTLYIITRYKPKIIIETIESDLKKFLIKNDHKTSYAANLKIEVAVVLGKYTYHFVLDRTEFIMLSPLNNSENKPYERVFQLLDIEENTKKIAHDCQSLEDALKLLENKGSYLRVRVYAQHEFSGFGKVFESRFIYDENSKYYKKIK